MSAVTPEVILPFPPSPFVLSDDPAPPSTPVGQLASARWRGDEIPYVAALLSSVRMDATSVSEKREAIVEELNILTRKLAALDTQLACLRDIESRLTRDLDA